MFPPPFDPSSMTELPFGTPGRIYRSPMPDTSLRLVRDYLHAGISVVVVLAEEEEWWERAGCDLLAYYCQQGLEVIHCPVPDYGVPDWIPFEAALQAAAEKASAGEHLVVHCYAGRGRTGTFMACLAHQLLGLDGEAAITWVRQFIPHAVENEDQIQFVKEFSG